MNNAPLAESFLLVQIYFLIRSLLFINDSLEASSQPSPPPCFHFSVALNSWNLGNKKHSERLFSEDCWHLPSSHPTPTTPKRILTCFVWSLGLCIGEGSENRPFWIWDSPEGQGRVKNPKGSIFRPFTYIKVSNL